MSRHSGALGLPPGLRLRDEAGMRVLRTPMEITVLMEQDPGRWAADGAMTWEQWRQLAQLVLDTPDPGQEGM